jgi:hypothetical protein
VLNAADLPGVFQTMRDVRIYFSGIRTESVMRKSRYTDEQIINCCRETARSPVVDVAAKKHGVSEQTPAALESRRIDPHSV